MILVIDDSYSYLLLISRLLNKFKLPCHVMTDSILAYDKLEHIKDTYDTIFLDIVMPIVGGLQIANKLRDLNYPGNIVSVSMYDKEEFISSTQAINYWLTKPIIKAELVSVLKDCKLI